jgi:hypothetical protein
MVTIYGDTSSLYILPHVSKTARPSRLLVCHSSPSQPEPDKIYNVEYTNSHSYNSSSCSPPCTHTHTHTHTTNLLWTPPSSSFYPHPLQVRVKQISPAFYSSCSYEHKRLVFYSKLVTMKMAVGK